MSSLPLSGYTTNDGAELLEQELRKISHQLDEARSLVDVHRRQRISDQQRLLRYERQFACYKNDIQRYKLEIALHEEAQAKASKSVAGCRRQFSGYQRALSSCRSEIATKDWVITDKQQLIDDYIRRHRDDQKRIAELERQVGKKEEERGYQPREEDFPALGGSIGVERPLAELRLSSQSENTSRSWAAVVKEETERSETVVGEECDAPMAGEARFLQRLELLNNSIQPPLFPRSRWGEN